MILPQWTMRLAALAALLGAGAARANPVDIFGAGFEGHGMAGARTALDSAGAAAYYNPAGLAEAQAARLDLSVDDVSSTLTYNGQNAGGEGFAGAELGMVLPLPGLLKGAAVGLYGFFPTDDLGRVVARDSNSPQFLQAGQIHRFALYTALAYKLGPVSLGAGVQMLNSASGSLNLQADLAGATVGQRTLQLDLVPTLSPVLGLTVDATSFLRLGASYRGAGQIEVQLPSNVGLGPLGIDLLLDSLNYWRPPTWTGGVAYHGKYLSADFDFSYLQWSQIPDPTLSASVTTTSSLLPALTTSPSGLKLQDSPEFRLGVDVPVELTSSISLAILAGYAYLPTPVPSQTGPSNILDNDRHQLSGGVAVNFPDALGLSNGPMTFALAGEYQAMTTRQVQKTDPLDLYGDASFGGSLFTFGATLTLRFGATP